MIENNNLFHGFETGKPLESQEGGKEATSSKQTCSSYVRKEVKTLVSLVIFQTLFVYVLPELITARTHECSRINYIVVYYSELFITVTPYFLRAIQFSFGLLCIAHVLLVPENKCLFLKTLLSDLKA